MWIVGFLFSVSAVPALAEQSMAGMAMHQKTAATSHQAAGKVVSVDKAQLTVKLAHEPIKSLNWPGMTMDFKVANAALLEGIKAGDAVTFELNKAESKKWEIVKIERK
jgi:Cu(I)/Ag(I) efflux system membrane fusion protein